MVHKRLMGPSAANGMTLALVAATLVVAAPAGAQSDLLSFYDTARATVAHPPAADSMRVTCSLEMPAGQTPLQLKGWFSLLAPPGQPAWIAAFTPQRIAKPDDALSTTPRYGPLPTARVTSRSTLDWAWIWDRNGDGHADYVAYLQNAHPVLPDPVPDSLPVPERSADGTYHLTMALVHAMIDNAQMIFRHYADDDFNGTADGVVVEEFDDRQPMFVRGWVVAFASKRDGVVDQAWAFRHAITDTTRTLARDADGTVRLPAVIIGRAQAESASARLERGTAVLRTINALIDRCGPGKGAIRRP